ncbi:MAG: hypothetical protein N2V76_09390 [Methanophagales archaeon]|nr:hypothetical protein [Methanophagales archaeon]
MSEEGLRRKVWGEWDKVSEGVKVAKVGVEKMEKSGEEWRRMKKRG